MKKFFSLLLTAAMMISTASVAFAADCNYSLTPATATVSAKNGDVIEFTLKLDTNPGIAGFVNIMEFDANAFENEVYIHQVIEDDEVVEELELDAYSSWGDLTVNTGIEGQTIFQYAGSKNKTGKTVLKVNYKVKETAVNGDYTFKLYAEEAMNQNGENVNVGEAIATITVVDGVSAGDDEPTNTITVSKVISDKVGNAARENMVTWGLAAVCDVDGAPTAETITFNVTAEDAENGKATKAFTYDLGVEDWSKIAAPFVFGLNIKGVPATGATITCDVADVTIQ